MLVRRICAALSTTALAFGGLVVAATPSYADDTCATAAPLAGNGAGVVGGADDNDYWAYQVTVPGTYRFTINHAPGTSVSMWAMSSDCSGTLCIESQASSPASCDAMIPTPMTVKVRVFSLASTDTAYTVSGVYRVPTALPTQCADSVDNDGDGWTDTADSGCAGPLDTSEGATADPCPSVGGIVPCVSLTATGAEITRVNVFGPTVDSVSVVGSVDLYQFTLPGGAKANVPCVVLAGAANPCADLGGTFFARMVTLAPVSVPDVDPILADPLATVGLCEATLKATVNDIGVEALPAVTVC